MLHCQQPVDPCYTVNNQWTHVTLPTTSGPTLHCQQPVDPCYTVNNVIPRWRHISLPSRPRGPGISPLPGVGIAGSTRVVKPSFPIVAFNYWFTLLWRSLRGWLVLGHVCNMWLRVSWLRHTSHSTYRSGWPRAAVALVCDRFPFRRTQLTKPRPVNKAVPETIHWLT